MRLACNHAHQLLETVYEEILISCSGAEVKLETRGAGVHGSQFAVHCSRFAVCCGASGSGDGAGLWLRDRMGVMGPMGLMWYAAPNRELQTPNRRRLTVNREPRTANREPSATRNGRGLADAGERI